MGRAPCCSVEGLKKGAWTEEDDRKLVDYIAKHGEGGWRSLPQKAGLLRCGKSCRLRWANYLKPGIKRGEFSPEEDETIIRLHSNLGNKWSAIAKHLPMRTDNEIKNYWNTQLKRRAAEVCDRNAEQDNEKNNAEAANDSTTSEKKELIESGILKGPISTPSKLLNEVAAKRRGSSSLALFMSQQIGKSKSLEGSSDSNACSAHLLNKVASNLYSSSPKSHSLSAIRAIFSTSLEGDHDVGVSTSTTSGSTNGNGPMGSPQSENAMQVLSPRTVSASASLLNRMATKLALVHHHPHLVIGDSKTLSCDSSDQESTRTESLASEPSLLMGDHSPLEMSHFDGTSASDNTGYPRNMAIEIDDRDDQPFFMDISDDHDDQPFFMDISDDHDDQKERELMGSFPSDEQVSVFTSGSDSYGGCSTPQDHVESIVGELEAAKNWDDSCIFIEELFYNAEIL